MFYYCLLSLTIPLLFEICFFSFSFIDLIEEMASKSAGVLEGDPLVSPSQIEGHWPAEMQRGSENESLHYCWRFAPSSPVYLVYLLKPI